MTLQEDITACADAMNLMVLTLFYNSFDNISGESDRIENLALTTAILGGYRYAVANYSE